MYVHQSTNCTAFLEFWRRYVQVEVEGGGGDSEGRGVVECDGGVPVCWEWHHTTAHRLSAWVSCDTGMC